MIKNVLSLFSGKTFIKGALCNIQDNNIVCRFSFLNTDSPNIICRYWNTREASVSKYIDLKENQTPLHIIADMLTEGESALISHISEIDIVAHILTQGGESFTDSVLTDNSVIEKIGKLPTPDINKQEAEIYVMKTALDVFKNIPNIAIFETAFFTSMLPQSYLYPIPYEFYEKDKLRKYGTHGVIHKAAAEKAYELSGDTYHKSKIISCYIGARCSICAVKDNICIDTTGGFNLGDGVFSSYGSGTIDPSVITYIIKKYALSPEAAEEILNRESGLRGVSGISGDYVELKKEANGYENKKARLTLELQQYSIIKNIGALVAALGGVDAVIFSGPVSVNEPAFVENILDNLSSMGISVDKDRYYKTEELSSDDSKVKAYIFNKPEELLYSAEAVKTIQKN